MRYLRAAFEAVPWWTLRPDQSLVREQPGEADVLRTAVAARSEDGNLAVVYLPAGSRPALNLSTLAPGLQATWVDPRDGSRHGGAAGALGHDDRPGTARPVPPGDGDWLLIYAAEEVSEGGRTP